MKSLLSQYVSVLPFQIYGENSDVYFQIYLLAAAAMQLIFWLVPNFIASAVAVAIVGFFLGPLFPAAVVATTKLLPQHLHIAGVGFAVSSGAAGACIMPFAVGAIAQAKGVQVLMPIILALLLADIFAWLWLPSLNTSGIARVRRRRLPSSLSAVSAFIEKVF